MPRLTFKTGSYDKLKKARLANMDRKTFEAEVYEEEDDLIRETEKELEEGEKPSNVISKGNFVSAPGEIDEKNFKEKKEPIKTERPKPLKIVY